MNKTARVIRKFNLIVPLCDIIVGEDHRASTRMIVGAAVMTFGVGLVKIGVYLGNHYAAGEHVAFVVHFITEEFGYMIHAIGATPYIELLAAGVSSWRTKVVATALAEAAMIAAKPDLEEPKE